MSLRLVTAPAALASSLSEVKAHLRITWDTEDDSITSYINAATEMVERETRRSLITTTYQRILPSFRGDDGEVILLPRPPIIAVSSIQYYDDDNVLQTLSSSSYLVDIYDAPGRIYREVESVYPSTYSRHNAVQINYTAGYGASYTSVPKALRLAIGLLVGHFYENRESSITGMMQAKIEYFERLINPYCLRFNAPERGW